MNVLWFLFSHGVMAEHVAVLKKKLSIKYLRYSAVSGTSDAVKIATLIRRTTSPTQIERQRALL